MNGFQFKLVAGFKLPAQFRHIHIHGSWRSICLRIPKLVHELGTGKSLSRIGKELVDDIELPCRHKEDRKFYSGSTKAAEYDAARTGRKNRRER